MSDRSPHRLGQRPSLAQPAVPVDLDGDRPSAPWGLTAAEVAERQAAGQVNRAPAGPSRTVRQIVRANVCTTFNALLGGC